MDSKETYSEIIDTQILNDGVYQLVLQNASDQSQVFDQDLLYHCLKILHKTLIQEDCLALYFQLSGAFRADDYKTKIREARSHERAALRGELLALIRALYAIKKPRVVAFDQLLGGEAISFVMQFDRRIAIGAGAGLSFVDSTFGLVQGWGTFPRILERIPPEYYCPILLNGSTLRNQDLLSSGLADLQFSDWQVAEFAPAWFNKLASITPWKIRNDMEGGLESLRERIRTPSLYERILIGLLENVRKGSIRTLLTREQAVYLRLLKANETVSRLRVGYYGIDDARQVFKHQKMDFHPEKASVLGAGMMGSGIAYQLAKSELRVVLKDVTLEQANRGKRYAEKIADRLVRKGQMQEESIEILLERIHTTDQIRDIDDSDVIIEAVFEDRELKGHVIDEARGRLSPDGIFASNTTSLPIGDLAHYFTDPEKFLGLHFFSPVDRMPLVEVIRGQSTSADTLGKALALIDRLGKIPIVVTDGPGFYTSRVFFNYLLEGISMLLEGIPIKKIEESAQQIGFPTGPLAVLDEISIPLMQHVYKQFPGLNSSQERVLAYLEKMVSKGRTGRLGGKGFYDYPEGASKHYWIDPQISLRENSLSNEEIGFRLLAIMALDSYRCLDEGVLRSPLDGDLGVVLGLGYPAYTGGVFGFIDQVGIQEFVQICQGYCIFGDQWSLPDSLIKLAKDNYQFYNGFTSNWTEKDTP